MNQEAKLRWEVIKEAWPYFKSSPIRWVKRWWMLRKTRDQRLEYLDKIASLHGVARLPGETDAQLRARLKARHKVRSKIELIVEVFEQYGIGEWKITEPELGLCVIETDVPVHWIARAEIEKIISHHAMGFYRPFRFRYERLQKESK